MASAFSHAIVALAMGKAVQNKELSWRELSIGALCSIVPDLDVIGFGFGIHYGDVWGHRGMTHSVVFAAMFAASLVALWYRTRPTASKMKLFLYFFLCTASHGVLDAVTNGGLGVAFFSPFDTTRYFFPLRPVLVSPIGISEFFSAYGARILLSEALWIWLPACVLFVAVRVIQRLSSGRSMASSS
ncbi:MAG TPA: metal-dependent hydrolase [Nitrospiraceae bacterium]|nr:metal-dependent hydrolase [Nitrospiraceae bacterium]